MDWREHITVDPAICHGMACFRGTRVPVSVVLDNLAVDIDLDDLLRNYPSLTRESIHAAIAYAAALTKEHVLSLPA